MRAAERVCVTFPDFASPNRACGVDGLQRPWHVLNFRPLPQKHGLLRSRPFIRGAACERGGRLWTFGNSAPPYSVSV